MESEKALDDLGWKLLGELQDNARLSYTELGRRLGLTAPAVAERVRRLEEAGIISGYHAEIDLARVGLPISALVRVRARASGGSAKIGQLTRTQPEVLQAYHVTGEDCYVMRIAARSVEHLGILIDQLGDYGDTTTSIILSTPVARREIGPAQIEQEAPAA